VTLPPVVLVALGGALGAVSRYGVYAVAVRWGDRLPLGTWAVNALGCLAVGVVLSVPLADRTRLVAVVGFLGAFTTFSTYSADTVLLWTSGRPTLAALNALGSVAVGLACTLAGIALGRALAP
jgi:CrcB protein